MKLRHCQRQAIAGIHERFKDHQTALMVAPTGFGKTVVFAHLIKEMTGNGNGRAMVIAHRDELLQQACDKIHRVAGIMPDVEKADQWADQQWQQWRSPVIVSSVQTQNSGRGGQGRMTRFNPDDFGLLIIDEAHHGTGPSYSSVLSHYRQNPKSKVLG